MTKDLIIELLSQDGYYTLNKKLVRIIGLENSFLLSFFIDKYKFFKEEFFYTKENILNDTRLTEYSLNSSLMFLKNNELILITKKGCPAKNYYEINFKKIEELLRESKENNKENINSLHTTSGSENTITSDFENNPASQLEIIATSPAENTITYNKNKVSKNKESITNKEKILKEEDKHEKIEDEKIKNEINKKIKKQILQNDPNFFSFLEIANRIKKLIETQKRINITSIQVANWATEIKKLYKTLESARGSENAIYSMFLMINTLNADIGYEDKYKPAIESGKSFREKFIKIEDYYKRRQIQYNKQQQEEGILI